MKLPDLEFELPEWNANDFSKIRRATTQVKEVASGVGTNSDMFKLTCQALKNIVLATGTCSIKTAIEVRAFTYLLRVDESFAEAVDLDAALLRSLLLPRSPMTRLALLQLIGAYFVRYDTVAKPDTLEFWRSTIIGQLKFYAGQLLQSDLAFYAQQASLVFSSHGPSSVLAYAKKQDIDLDVAIGHLRLDSFAKSRYLTLCRYAYYVQTLNEIAVGEDHSVLAEVVKEAVYNAPDLDGKFLGHRIISILIDRSAGQTLSDSWQRVILTIAGDPRVPKSTGNYQKWWQLLGEERIALMRGWLSRLDLTLFLRVLEQSAKDGSNADMERMFASRKVFMEGLLSQGVVVESRLFFASAAERYLLRNYMDDELPSYARVAGGQASVIYLKLRTGLHLVEGTHSFSIRVMDKLPAASNITNYGVETFISRDLGAGLGNMYEREFGDDEGLLVTRHHPNLGWQNRVIEYLKIMGLDLNDGDLIPPNSYRQYKSRYGAF